METRSEDGGDTTGVPLLPPPRLSLSELVDDAGTGPLSPLRSPGRRLLRSESTRLRANVAEHVQRDLMPAGRLLSICLVSCEMVAEAVVLLLEWKPKCNFELKTWVIWLMFFQTAIIGLNLLRISYARYLSRRIDVPEDNLSLSNLSLSDDESSSSILEGMRRRDENMADVLARAARVTKAVTIVNLLYFAMFIIGFALVTKSRTCVKTDGRLYRLVLALTIIYFGLLGLPLACFCFILCCLPCFIRLIPLYLSERSSRQHRAASSSRISELPLTDYDPDNFKDGDEASCVICLNPYEVGERLRSLPCKHEYHSKCVDHWLMIDKSCPLCKQDIDQNDTNSDV